MDILAYWKQIKIHSHHYFSSFLVMFSDTQNICEDLQYYAHHDLVTKTSRFRKMSVFIIRFNSFELCWTLNIFHRRLIRSYQGSWLLSIKIEKIVLIKHSTAEHKQSGEEDWAFPADNSKAVEEVNKEYSEKLRRTVLLTLEWLKRKQNVADAYRNLI